MHYSRATPVILGRRKNSLEKDSSNAVLTRSGIKTQIVILNGIHVDKSSVRMPIPFSKDAHDDMSKRSKRGLASRPNNFG